METFVLVPKGCDMNSRGQSAHGTRSKESFGPCRAGQPPFLSRRLHLRLFTSSLSEASEAAQIASVLDE